MLAEPTFNFCSPTFPSHSCVSDSSDAKLTRTVVHLCGGLLLQTLYLCVFKSPYDSTTFGWGYYCVTCLKVHVKPEIKKGFM